MQHGKTVSEKSASLTLRWRDHGAHGFRLMAGPILLATLSSAGEYHYLYFFEKQMRDTAGENWWPTQQEAMDNGLVIAEKFLQQEKEYGEGAFPPDKKK